VLIGDVDRRVIYRKMFIAGDKVKRELICASETSSEERRSYTADDQLQQLQELCRRPDMRSLLDEISRDYEMHTGHHHQHHHYHHHHYHHHHQQQQQWSQRHGDVSSRDVNNTSSVMSLSDDEYASWFGWTMVELDRDVRRDSPQHSSSRLSASSFASTRDTCMSRILLLGLTHIDIYTFHFI